MTTIPGGITALRCNRHTDFVFAFNWKDADGVNQDLTGWAISKQDVSAVINPYLTVEITNAATGLITTRIEWNDAIEGGVPYRYRVKLTSGVEDVSSNLIAVLYQ